MTYYGILIGVVPAAWRIGRIRYAYQKKRVYALGPLRLALHINKDKD